MDGKSQEQLQHLKQDFIPYMGNVARCERELTELDFNWRMIETIAKMACPSEAKNILPTMARTRAGFAKLEAQLLDNLILETIKKVVLEVRSKAQVVVDIVIRNLFERTADVGFLATDANIRQFILQEEGAPSSECLRARLAEYRDKYTVYDEIIILNTKGRVLTHLNTEQPLTTSADPLLAQTLASSGYVETFRATDLRPGQAQALIYSQRIEHPETGEPIGVLCLSFRFADEMAGIFQRLSTARDRSVLLLLDGAGRVIASSDEHHVPLGCALEMVEGEYGIVAFGGREYLAKTCETVGYQGYTGMGWRGHVMVPLHSAFKDIQGDALASIEKDTLAAILGNADQFCPALADIAQDAESINLALRRVVWSGQVMAAGASNGKSDLSRLKVILQQISETGDRTSQLFADSIRDLYGTVISSLLADAQFIAGLMIDIMDRNLYERANDCRWWALTEDIRRIMAAGDVSPESLDKINGILAYINSLYTVYTRLFVYDLEGNVMAASDLHQDGLAVVGKRVEADYVARVCRLQSSQQYCVSAFEKSWLYGGFPTYIYNAAIRDPADPARVVGGIGIVFDSGPEFRNMLKAALPNKEGAFALFLDRKGIIVSTTSEAHPVGRRFALEEGFFSLESGKGLSSVIELEGQLYIVGACMSSGYREYKRSGDYQNDILAAVFVPIGKKLEAGAPKAAEPIVFPLPKGRETAEFATFFIGPRLYALPATAVIDSVDADSLSRMGGARRYLAGILTLPLGGEESNSIVPTLDMHYLLELKSEESRNHIIIIRTSGGPLGLLVSDLHQVPEFDVTDIEDVPEMIRQDAGYIASVIHCPGLNRVVQVLDPEKILQAARAH